MTAVLLDDIDVMTTTPPTALLALAPEPQRVTKRVRRTPIDTGGDPTGGRDHPPAELPAPPHVRGAVAHGF